MTRLCREGHASTDADYCSVCGIGIGAPAPLSAPARASPGGGAVGPQDCPRCGERRAGSEARFCEVCRFDFVDGTQGPPPGAPEAVALASAVPAPPIGEPRGAVPTNASATGWEVVVRLDASLDTEPDPGTPFPSQEPERTFPLDLAESLVGRRDDRRDIKPEIPVADPGASRRHAKLLRNADGTVALQDLASSNGTQVNGQEVPPGTRRALKAGDQVTLGRWTRLLLRARR